ncbi:MAG: DUF2125 domain-containing protein [Alphaproteobacteria bacterium]
MRLAPRPLLALSALALLAAGYTAFWFYEAGVVRSGLAEWTAVRRAEGMTVDYEAPRISGFPLRIKARVEHPTIADPAQHWRWRGDAVEAAAFPWAFRHVTVHPIGRQELSFVVAGDTAVMTASAAEASATVAVGERGALQKGSFDAADITLSLPGAAGAVSARLVHVELAAAASPSGDAKGPALAPSLAIALRIEDLTLPAAAAGPLGPQLGQLTAEGQLRGPLDGKSALAALAGWRDAGGTLELKSFSLAWGPLQLAGNATLALDPNMQPEGAGTAQIRGFEETIDGLVEHGLVKANDGAIAKGVLGLLAKTPPDGGPKLLTVSLTIQKQALYAGPIRLLRLPTLRWAG